MKTRKLLAILLILAMMMGLLCTGAVATTTLQTGSGVTDISISGVGISDVTYQTQDINNSYSNHRYINNVLLPSGTANNASITINFTKESGTVLSPTAPNGSPNQFFPIVMRTATDTYTVNLSNGVGSVTVYAHHNIPSQWQNCDVYVINFSKGTYANPQQADCGLWLRFGDPHYELSAPECYMEFSGSGDDYDVIYSGPYGSQYYPDTLAFYIDNPDDIVGMVGTNITITTYDNDYTVLQSGSSLTLPAALTKGFYALNLAAGQSTYTLEITTSDNDVVTLTFSQPIAYGSTGGVAPNAVVSYLPIGQFATGTGWGSSAGKLVSNGTSTGYSSTGVSLGALGGYIEFYFAYGIENDVRNPYGVDFVVYGNAFNGNPEAGAVQVSEDGTEWYELAGSLYYEKTATGTTSTATWHNGYTGTLRNADVTYTYGDSNNDGNDDIGASLTNGTVTLNAAPFTTATTWWPNSSVYPMGGQPHTDNNVSVSFGSTSLAFGGVTAVQDSDDTAFYSFGYADVTPNGTISNYGDATNPYTAYTSSKVGGDGFDLEWAVEIDTGTPVNVSGMVFHYVRVYSAVLDNWQFGETSTEVCGVFSAYRTSEENGAISGVGYTNAPTIYVDGTGLSLADYVSFGMASYTTEGNVTIYDATGLVSGAISASGASGTNIYVNNDANSHTVVSGEHTVRVIAQSGNAAPSISLIKF